MQRLKRAIKKMAAIGTGVAMLGATMTGAIAQDLADYPAPFVGASGVFDASTAIVVGDAAASADTLGAIDIATNLQFMAKTPVQSGAGTVQVTGGVTEDIPIDRGIANNSVYTFEWNLDDTDLDSFMDTTVQFQGKDYDIHDELVLKMNSPSIETSITADEDSYEDNVFMEVKKKSIYYFLMVDDTDLNISKATTSEPFEVKFLGKTLKVTDVPYEDGYTNRFTAYVGTEYFMDVGDTVTVDGKKVTLLDVGQGDSVMIDVDGTIDVMSEATATINGIEIAVDETFYSSAKQDRAAALVIGKDAEATYRSGDPFIGEDESHPNWKWTIGQLGNTGDTNLNTSAPIDNDAIEMLPGAQGYGPYLGIYNNFRATSDSDDIKGVGECYDLPNNYASICLDSLTVADDDYLTVTLEFIDDAPLDESLDSEMTASQAAIYLHAPGDNRFKIRKQIFKAPNGTLGIAADIKTSEIWLSVKNATGTGVYIRDKEHIPDIRLLGTIRQSIDDDDAEDQGKGFALVNFGDTKDANVNFSIYNTSTTRTTVEINVRGDAATELTPNTDDIFVNFTHTAADFTSMGDTVAKEEADELMRGGSASDKARQLGEKDEDHRTTYGIIIKDPKSNGAGDTVVLEIPSDQVQANVVIKGQAATVAGGATSYIPADITIDTKLSSEVAGSETAHQLILVGGPCANPTVEAVSSLGSTCSGWDLDAGEAILKMASNGNKIALLVAGTDAVDTRMAAKVVANYEDYDLSGSSVVVTGSMSSPSLRVA